jgi:hypothetical protein
MTGGCPQALSPDTDRPQRGPLGLTHRDDDPTVDTDRSLTVDTTELIETAGAPAIS